MSDRSGKPDRARLLKDATQPESPREEAPRPRHPISSPPIDSSETNRLGEVTDRSGPTDDDTRKLAQTIRGLIQSLPRRQIGSAQGILESAADAIVGAVAPTFEEQSPVDRRAEAEDGGREDDSISPVSGSSRLPAPGGHVGTTALSDSGALQRREEIVSASLIAPLLGGACREPDGNPTANRWPDPGGVAIASPAFSDDRAGCIDSREARATESTPPPLMDSSSAVPAAVAVAGNVDFHADLGRRIYRPDHAVNDPTMYGVGSSVGTLPEMVAIGPIGPTGRLDEGFDRASGESVPSMSLAELAGADSAGGPRGAASAREEGAIGVDLSPTNALLGQILDELRRHQQPAQIASGRSVYPER